MILKKYTHTKGRIKFFQTMCSLHGVYFYDRDLEHNMLLRDFVGNYFKDIKNRHSIEIIPDEVLFLKTILKD